MKILWVEDFGDLQTSKIILEVFEELFHEVDLSGEYDDTNEDVAGQLSALFAKHTLHDVYVCKSYVEWKDLDQQHGGDFDIALIDINLESYPTSPEDRPAGIVKPEFDRNAGFYIYHQLIRRGFPDNNIAFFTAQGQSLKEFSQYCGDIFLDRPTNCFQKISTQFRQVRRWLSEKAHQPSLILRRGVIEGCRFIKAKIEGIDSADLISQLIFYKTIPGKLKDGPEALRQDCIRYLNKLERPFLLHQDYGDTDFRRSFINELASKWEESWGSFIRAKERPQFATWLENQFHKTAQLQMKILRNWSNHRQLSFDLTERDLAYYFMLAMRALIVTDLNRVFRYEEILSTVFGPLSEMELKRRLNSSFELHLEKSYEELKALHAEILRHIDDSSRERMGQANLDRRMENYFLAILRETGEAAKWLKSDSRMYCLSRIREESRGLFYQSFWHGLFPMEIKTTYYANLQKVKFYTQPLPPSFVSFLGRTIFAECFKEADTTKYITQLHTIPLAPNNRR